MKIHAETDSQLVSSFLITKFKTQNKKKFLTVCSGSVTLGGRGSESVALDYRSRSGSCSFFLLFFFWGGGGFFLFSLVAFKMLTIFFLRFLLKGTFKPIFKFKHVISTSQNCRNQVLPNFFSC